MRTNEKLIETFSGTESNLKKNCLFQKHVLLIFKNGLLVKLQLLNRLLDVVEGAVVELFSWRHQKWIPTSVENSVEIKKAVTKLILRHIPSWVA